jgi:LysM repeat protein
MDKHRRQELVRVAAPVCFLLVATIAILLIRSGLHGDAAPAQTTTVTKKKHPPRTRTIVPIDSSTATQTAVAPPAGRTYTVKEGDTLGSIAAKQRTTVDELLATNPGIDPTGLQIGDKIRLP